jgi:hypothetical protein
MVIVLALASIGFGQTRTVKQQVIRNAVATWVKAGEAPNGDGLYLNTKSIDKLVTLALFDVKLERNGIVLYMTVAVNCVAETYLATNVFVQSTPTAHLVRMKMYDMRAPVALDTGGLQDAAMYACRTTRSIDNL